MVRLFIFEIKLNCPITCRSISPGDRASLLVNLQSIGPLAHTHTDLPRACVIASLSYMCICICTYAGVCVFPCMLYACGWWRQQGMSVAGARGVQFAADNASGSSQEIHGRGAEINVLSHLHTSRPHGSRILLVSSRQCLGLVPPLESRPRPRVCSSRLLPRRLPPLQPVSGSLCPSSRISSTLNQDIETSARVSAAGSENEHPRTFSRYL